LVAQLQQLLQKESAML